MDILGRMDNIDQAGIYCANSGKYKPTAIRKINSNIAQPGKLLGLCPLDLPRAEAEAHRIFFLSS